MIHHNCLRMEKNTGMICNIKTWIQARQNIFLVNLTQCESYFKFKVTILVSSTGLNQGESKSCNILMCISNTYWDVIYQWLEAGSFKAFPTGNLPM